MSSKPHEQGGEVDHALVGLGGLVMASGDGAVLLEAAEAAFDHVAPPVDQWPGSRLVEVAGEGHMDWFADPSGLVKLTREFIDGPAVPRT